MEFHDEDKFSESLEDFSTVRIAHDALLCKVSAEKAGYYNDKYIERMLHGVKKVNAPSATKKSPMINRGYYARIEVINILIERYLSETAGRVQIVNLGCGFDTRSLGLVERHGRRVQIYEVDYHSIITKKAYIVENDSHLREPIAHGYAHDDEHHTIDIENHSYGHKIGNVVYISADLRDGNTVTSRLLSAGIDCHAPTIVLTECVLIYLEKSAAEKVIEGVSALFHNGMWLSYDMTNPNDVFGRNMHHNLVEAGYHIHGFTDYPTLQCLVNRFLNIGWKQVQSRTMLDLFQHIVPNAEHRRISRLEIFDEVEEFNMLMEHYALTVAVKGKDIVDIMG